MRTLSLLFFCLFFLAEISIAKNNAVLSGKITNTESKPLAGVFVSVEHEGVIKAKTITDAKGEYLFNKLEAGNYEVRIAAAGYESQGYLRVGISQVSKTLELNATLRKEGPWGNSELVKIYNPSYQSGDPEVFPRVKPSMHRKGPGRYTSLSAAEVRTTRSYSKALIDPASPGGHSTHTSEDIELAPTRHVTDIASPGTHIYEEKSDASIGLGGGRVGSGSSMVEAAPPVGISSGIAVSTTYSPAPKAGLLTSGEINDFSKWTLWQDITMSELKSYRSTWPFLPEKRFTVMLKNADGKPICNAAVTMTRSGDKLPVWEAVTDNTGKAELWDNMYLEDSAKHTLSATVSYIGKTYTVASLKEFHDDANIINTRQSCFSSGKLDIAFIVDATGSMQDEIDYLKAELTDILGKVKDSLPSLQVHTGCVFYRDLEDEYVVKISDLKPDFNQTLSFIKDNYADGGGDFPEAADLALQQALDNLHWRDDAVARIAFLILDAPPHSDAATVKRMQQLAYQYAKRGIRLVPVVCSGSDKSTEYLMRSLALATNGTYLFLTNHSGIGGSHMEPTTDKYDVEYLNGLIYRVIYQFSYMPACEQKLASSPADTTSLHHKIVSDSTKVNQEISWKYYPNPTTGILHIEHKNTVGEMYVCDVSGKAIMRFNADPSGFTTIDLSNYPSGIYFIKYHYSPEHSVDGKFVVMH